MDREALTPILRKTTRLPAEDAVHMCRAASQPHWAVCLWLRYLLFFFFRLLHPLYICQKNFCSWCKCDWLHSLIDYMHLFSCKCLYNHQCSEPTDIGMIVNCPALGTNITQSIMSNKMWAMTLMLSCQNLWDLRENWKTLTNEHYCLRPFAWDSTLVFNQFPLLLSVAMFFEVINRKPSIIKRRWLYFACR